MINVNVGIVGITGYAGIELVKLIHCHPCLNLIGGFSSAVEQAKEQLAGEAIPLYGLDELAPVSEQIDVLLLATPPEASLKIIQMVKHLNIKVVDLSGACRLPEGLLNKWYGIKNPIKELANGAHYGLSPWNMESCAEQSIIANPGCYATAALMSLLPLLTADIICPSSIIIDAKSGTSGAGKQSNASLSFSEMADNFFPYKIGVHQHIPEIKNALTKFGKQSCDITMVTQMLPLKTGIAMTIYANINNKSYEDVAVLKDINMAYNAAYQHYPLVEVNEISKNGGSTDHYWLALKNVVGTAKTHISYFIENGKVILFVCIDNLLKGAASQTIENINAMYKLPVYTGLMEKGELV